MKWRTIITDTESETGVAPVCEQQDNPEGEHRIQEEHFDGQAANSVFDCCPHPQIETYSEPGARSLASLLTALDAESCRVRTAHRRPLESCGGHAHVAA